MNRPVSQFLTSFWLLTLAVAPASAQVFESVGQRALGMGGAFVAVANDSSATWWNPAGLATGPFLDMSLGGNSATADGDLPGSDTGVWSFSIGTPPLGLSYYRLHLTDTRPLVPTGASEGGRQDRAAGVGIRSLSVSQFGATVLHTITTGVSAGATVKFLRGTARVRQIEGAEADVNVPELLDAADDLDGGDGHGTLDVDVGVLAVYGALRLGLTGRNLREPSFDGRHLARQVRAGVAYDGAAVDRTAVVMSLDVDLGRYEATAGERRVIAVGSEYWLRPERIGLRGGAMFNTVGERDRAVTAGASVAARPGLFVEGHAAFGSNTGESGWGIAARVSF